MIKNNDGVVRKIIAEVLGQEESTINENDNLFDLGMDSILLMVTITQIEKQCSKRISVFDFFQNPTIKGLEKIVCNNNSY